VLSLLCWALAAIGFAPGLCAAHGLVGKRFFPTTVTIEDPFVADELSLVAGSGEATGEPEVEHRTAGAVKFTRRVTERTGLWVGEEFRDIKLEEDGSRSGFGNFEFGVKYRGWESAEHEAVVALGLRYEIGGTGAARVEAKPYSVVTPTLYLGKGFGDLPDSLRVLRPLAVTGVAGLNLPTRRSSAVGGGGGGEGGSVRETNPVTLSWGVALQYSLGYPTAVEEAGRRSACCNRTTLVLEFPMETDLGGERRGKTTGMVAPGVVWVGKRFELGIAAQIPINDDSGRGVGVIALVHFFLDDLFANPIGRPRVP
jgi:hypothetical protein